MILQFAATVLFVLVILVVISYGIIIFNSLQRIKNNIFKAQANIDVLLKQRFNEVPNLIEVCKEYIKHEKSIFKNLAKIRTNFVETDDLVKKNKINEKLNQALVLIAEDYPKLKSSQNFLTLQNRLSDLEDRIADRREFYNDNVTMLNTRIESFPDNLVAKLIGYRKYPLFLFDNEDLI